MGFFDKIKSAFRNFNRTEPQFDPTTLNDEVALRTSWEYSVGGGTSFCSHYLKADSPSRVRFVASDTAVLFPCLFIVAGMLVLTALAFGWLQQWFYIAIAFGTVNSLCGFLILRSWKTPRIFDFDIGYYWKGRCKASDIARESRKESCQLADIHAIQLLQEYCESNGRDGGTSYFSYELNLVLANGDRLNVVDHGERSMIRSDAKKLAKFLDVAVWDATTQ